MSRRALLWVAGVVVLAAVIAVVVVLRPGPEVQTIRPTTETLRAYVEERAVTELPRDYLISMPISGWLQPIDLREGDAVQKDQVIARLDTHDLEDHVRQAQQRIAVLDSDIAKESDNRLENNMLVDANATVKAIDETVRSAEAKLEASKAVFDFAEREAARYRTLDESGKASEREVHEAETAFRKAKAEYQSDALELAALKTIAAVSYIGPKFITDYIDRKSFNLESLRRQVEEARLQLEIEKRNLQRASVACPVEGIVLERMQTRRQFLAAGTPLLTVGRLSDMEVIAEVLTERATQIIVGDPVEIFGQGLPEGPVTGKVLRIYPAGFTKVSSLGVEQQRVKVAIGFDNRPERLGTGFRVYVRIFYDEASGAMTLPRTTLFRTDSGDWQAMVVENGRTSVRTVEVGLMTDEKIQIKTGLDSADQVVANPARDIEPGMKVRASRVEN